MWNWKRPPHWGEKWPFVLWRIFLKLRFFCPVYQLTCFDPFRSLDSWTLFSGLETSGLFSRRPAGILRARDTFQTQWRDTPVAITKAGTTKTAMDQAVGTTSRRVWGHPRMSLANSPVAPLLLLIRFNRVVLAFFQRQPHHLPCQWQENFLRVSISY